MAKMARKGINPERFSPENRPVVEALLSLGEELKARTPAPSKEAMEKGKQQLLEAAAQLTNQGNQNNNR